MSVDPDLLTFIREHIRSVWALELLLLLKRNPERRWTPDELVRELRASASLITNNLDALQRAGLIALDEDGRCRYAPAGPVLDRLCNELEAAYRERPVALINVIASPPDKLQSLADAFRIRKP
ncbi:MarR family transcriptional regulator [Phenylobacterium sp.]|uniref:MarR family transcriptional regulator n=1 Tax=Phenylobacterium sp. TaxID=1871053 RepID=UPI002E30444B|nr:MarR family transcriptional regulator [Phenylobacterium sp.]HEX2559263.1 MarR family transcriptional regulator [Phenylobacterium sp.]